MEFLLFRVRSTALKDEELIAVVGVCVMLCQHSPVPVLTPENKSTWLGVRNMLSSEPTTAEHKPIASTLWYNRHTGDNVGLVNPTQSWGRSELTKTWPAPSAS